MCLRTSGEVEILCHILKNTWLILYAKFDENQLNILKVMVKKTFDLLFYGYGIPRCSHSSAVAIQKGNKSASITLMFIRTKQNV